MHSRRKERSIHSERMQRSRWRTRRTETLAADWNSGWSHGRTDASSKKVGVGVCCSFPFPPSLHCPEPARLDRSMTPETHLPLPPSFASSVSSPKSRRSCESPRVGWAVTGSTVQNARWWRPRAAGDVFRSEQSSRVDPFHPRTAGCRPSRWVGGALGPVVRGRTQRLIQL